VYTTYAGLNNEDGRSRSRAFPCKYLSFIRTRLQNIHLCFMICCSTDLNNAILVFSSSSSSSVPFSSDEPTRRDKRGLRKPPPRPTWSRAGDCDPSKCGGWARSRSRSHVDQPRTITRLGSTSSFSSRARVEQPEKPREIARECFFSFRSRPPLPSPPPSHALSLSLSLSLFTSFSPSPYFPNFSEARNSQCQISSSPLSSR